ncbi:hypothetical protein HLB03_01415, partial [Acidianus sp. DSM 29099]|nr:hypothetical protein [Acidianus sp. RZ1]
MRKSIEELKKISQENTTAIIELKKRTEENSNAIAELRKSIAVLTKISQENTTAIIELKKKTEENSNAIAALRKATQEHSVIIEDMKKSITRLETAVESLTNSVDKLAKVVEEHNKRLNNLEEEIGGLSDSFGMVTEIAARKAIMIWFEKQGIKVNSVGYTTLIINDKPRQFDLYVESGNKLYVGEIKATLSEERVTKFSNKIKELKSVENREVIPLIIYLAKSKGDSINLAKNLGIKVFKLGKLGDII